MLIGLNEINFCNENENSARNFNSVTIGDAIVYFSYDTAVAFCTPQQGLVVCENIWGTTTGKHLNWLSKDKSIRLPKKEFDKRLESIKIDVTLMDLVPEQEVK